jgi:hypothetical protein
MKTLLVLIGLSYIVIGLIKLKWFDWNKEGDWLLMLSDNRNRRCNVIWVYILLLVTLFTWPLGLFNKKTSLARSFFQFQWRR